MKRTYVWKGLFLPLCVFAFMGMTLAGCSVSPASSGSGTDSSTESSSSEDGDTEDSGSDSGSEDTGGSSGSDGSGGFDEAGGGDGMGDGGGSSDSGSSSSDVTYSAAYMYTEDTTVSGVTLTSTGTDENVVMVDGGASVLFDDVTFVRSSSDSTGGDNSSFYGVGAAVLAYEGTAYLSGGTVTSDAKGGAGVFAYGDSTAYVADTVISTSMSTSGGIHAAGGGTLYAWDVTATTQGESAAAIRSDRGGGTMVVDGGTYTSNGTGSPSVYCTADIAVNDATLTANDSEAICIEGLNTLSLFDCDLSGTMRDDSQNDTTWTVTLYQSQSGDSEIGESSFYMGGGSLKSGNGGLFYTTNTESSFVLSGVDITPCSDSEFFLQCTGNANERGWGSTGSNGADCEFTAISQEMEGDVIWDSVSTLDFYMTSESTLEGAFLDDETWAGDGGDGTCSLYIDSGSVWTVTEDSTLTSLYCAGSIVDGDGNTVSVVGTDGTVYVSGTGSVTVTVESYSSEADVSGCGSTQSFSSYAVDRPDSLS